jgi:hypothetical protein
MSGIEFPSVDDVNGATAFVADLIRERDDMRRVIARLLDGWRPASVGNDWFRWGDSSGTDRQEPMSDGEAAIIRNHQEKTQ